jgi:UDP-N-acetylmuramate dehydrogenase
MTETGHMLLTVAAGEMLDDIIQETVDKKLWGLENLSAIPGTVGATPVQNVGAYGVEVSALIESVSAIHSKTGEEKIFSNDDCQFSYRDSYFKTETGKSWIITSVTFILQTTPNPQLTYADLAPLLGKFTPTPAMVRSLVQNVRANKFPDWSRLGTAGSFFKNPVITETHFRGLQNIDNSLPGFKQENGLYKVPLGYILDKVCGLKGYTKGSVALYEKQALVLVANQGATATEVKNFVEEIREVVLQKTNIQIECEVRFV